MKTPRLNVSSRWLAFTAVGLAFGLGALANAQPTPQVSAMNIILVDRNAFFSESTVGQDVARQVQTLQKNIEADLTAKANKLRLEEEQLMSQQGVLTQEAFEAKAQKLRDQRLALQREADQQSRLLQEGVLRAQNQIWQNASPILDTLLKEKRAALMIDRSAVVKGSVDLDVTATALQRLNEKLPSIKVELAKPAQTAPKVQTPSAQAPKPQ